jgi:drug/metabolite transporter (DMT)-like permease
LIWLLPAALCSISIALILKVNEGRGGDRVVIAGANYLTAAAVSAIMPGAIPAAPDAAVVALGCASGAVYVLGFLLLMAGIARGPLAVPVTVARLSVIIPVVVSILLWREAPGPAQWGGILLGVAAMWLFGLGVSSGGVRVGVRYGGLMLALFLALGTGDVLLKAFRETSGGADRAAFTWILFTTAAVLTWAIVAARRVRPDGRTFALGLLLGVPNLGSTVFTLLALRTVGASIAFPFINLAVIAGSTALGYAIWRERPGRFGLAGLVLASAAIVLLASG